jgi:hypothetical protein
MALEAPLAVVEFIVGHSNPAMTRHYTHVGELAAGTGGGGVAIGGWRGRPCACTSS